MDALLVYAGFALGGYIAIVAAVNQRRSDAESGTKVICPHCQTKGQVKVTTLGRKRGISGGKATGALMTGGASMLATGLSRKQAVRHMACGNCRVEWDVE